MATVEAPAMAPVITEIGPEEAKALLGRNTHNRKLRPARVTQLAGAMDRDEWVFNGEPIRVADTGRLLDGQHRLAAVLESGIPQRFLVIDGLSEGTQETMDAGAKRTVADVLKLRGEKDVNRLAAMARLVLNYEARLTFRNGPVQPTTQEIIAGLERHPGIRDAIAPTRPAISNTRVASGPMGACYFLFSLVDAADAAAFAHSFSLGAGLPPGSPIFACRRIFTNPRPQGGIPAYFQGAYLIKAFNQWRRGDEVKNIYWRPGGTVAEKFPLVEGLNWHTDDPEARSSWS